jgi:hypothetical protein
MVPASGLQLRRKALASLICAWFVACGFAARRHEATVAHAVELATGEIVHAERLTGHHDDDRSDVHDRSSAGDHGACGDVAMLRTVAVAGAAPSTAAIASAAVAIADHVSGPAISAAVIYELAPKTSPPVA